MNPVAVALERAVAIAGTLDQLQAAFDREWPRVEFAPDAESVVIGVPEVAAWQWWRGELTDLDLALATCDSPGAAFWMGLPNHDTYLAGWQRTRELVRGGAVLCVFLTSNPVLLRHAHRFGFRARVTGEGTFLLGEGPGLRRWLKL